MKHLCLRVEPLGASPILAVLKEAKELCQKLDIAYVCLNVKGKEIKVSRNTNPELLLDKIRFGRKDEIVG